MHWAPILATSQGCSDSGGPERLRMALDRRKCWKKHQARTSSGPTEEETKTTLERNTDVLLFVPCTKRLQSNYLEQCLPTFASNIYSEIKIAATSDPAVLFCAPTLWRAECENDEDSKRVLPCFGETSEAEKPFIHVDCGNEQPPVSKLSLRCLAYSIQYNLLLYGNDLQSPRKWALWFVVFCTVGGGRYFGHAY